MMQLDQFFQSIVRHDRVHNDEDGRFISDRLHELLDPPPEPVGAQPEPDVDCTPPEPSDDLNEENED